MHLKELDWDNGSNLEELIILGIDPTLEFIKIIDETIEDYNNELTEEDSKRLCFAIYQIRDELQELNDTVYKWLDGRREDTKEQKVVNL